MQTPLAHVSLPLSLAVLCLVPAAAAPEGVVSGELKAWHKVTLTLDGPAARERDTAPNPFLDHRLTVRFTHESGSPAYDVPGYFAADGNAGETSAEAGAKWRAHLSPDKAGRWTWRASMVRGPRVAVEPAAKGEPVAGVDGLGGSFEVLPTDKAGRDFRPGDPTWRGGRGKGLVGALNYLASRGVNAFSFLTYNAGGDGDNVWPFVERDLKLHYDCSKLDQWQVVFDHAQSLGLFLHFKTQETEMDDQRLSHERTPGKVREALDGGAVGVERRLYYRELVARFGYELALNWNLGEENTQTPEEQRAMAAAFRELDPYGHLVVIHTHPGDQDLVYEPLLGPASGLTGASLQNHWAVARTRSPATRPRTTAATPSRSAASSTSSTCRKAARPSSTSRGRPARSPSPGSTHGSTAPCRRAP